ncbi:hypothetical protein ARAM_007285 [Aspergillus rambellii]|uniref:Coenzyme Q-binding protein COQ10 START domain-containing protein n=1 Tax=Aspergillus rambellii TaxID=308745 RepID=A0A0F8VAX3_9EURO|nr:hypothetical protein ARAM_007285 [Aspergillus rambellii]
MEQPATPTIQPGDAVLQLQSSVLIDAPIAAVWNALTDTSTWAKWNQFVPRVTMRAQQPDLPSLPSVSSDQQQQQQQQQQQPLSPVLRQGSHATFHVRMNAASPGPQREATVHLTVTECSPPDLLATTTTTTNPRARIVWVNDAPAQGFLMSSLLTAERVHELSVVDVAVGGEGEGGKVKQMTRVRNWENQTGYLAYVVRWMYGRVLREDFEIWVQGLKEYVELV